MVFEDIDPERGAPVLVLGDDSPLGRVTAAIAPWKADADTRRARQLEAKAAGLVLFRNSAAPSRMRAVREPILAASSAFVAKDRTIAMSTRLTDAGRVAERSDALDYLCAELEAIVVDDYNPAEAELRVQFAARTAASFPIDPQVASLVTPILVSLPLLGPPEINQLYVKALAGNDKPLIAALTPVMRSLLAPSFVRDEDTGSLRVIEGAPLTPLQSAFKHPAYARERQALEGLIVEAELATETTDSWAARFAAEFCDEMRSRLQWVVGMIARHGKLDPLYTDSLGISPWGDVWEEGWEPTTT